MIKHIPAISVMMVVYNAESFLKDSIDSILRQSFKDFEFIIIDDGSTDRTIEILHSYNDDRIVFYEHKHDYIASLNLGLSLCKGRYIARMDADDISLPERFEKQAAYLDEHPGTAVLGAALERFGEGIPTQLRRFSATPAEMKVDLLFTCGLAHPSVMMRRAVICELGGYDLEFEGMEDYELWCRVAREHQVTTLDEVLLRYRIHPQQVTKNPSEKYIARMRRLKAAQLSALGLPTEGDCAECFYDFCLGQRPREPEQILRLSLLLEEVAAANEEVDLYDKNILKKTLANVLLGYVSKLPRDQISGLWEGSRLLTRGQVTRRRAKDRVKRLLGRT